jgi:uncharacterized membrane protein YphA (DoxX/SURF4 family)
MNVRTKTPGRAGNYGLWTLQLLLSLLFLFAGGTKLVLPLDVLASMGFPNQVQLPGAFIRFIGAAEVLGALGLVLPGLLRVRRELTPVAGAGLIIIMIGATILTMASGEFGFAAVPFVVGLLLTLDMTGRRSYWIAARRKTSQHSAAGHEQQIQRHAGITSATC